jgi:hypothetical protein
MMLRRSLIAGAAIGALGIPKAKATLSMGMVPPGAWTPARMSNMVLWLRADLGVTASSGSVTTWADQSGNGNDFTQSTTARKPTTGTTVAGKPALHFDGTQWLHCANSFNYRPLTVYVICQRTGTSANNAALFSTDEPALAGQSIGWSSGNAFQVEVKDVAQSFTSMTNATVAINTPACLGSTWVGPAPASSGAGYCDPTFNNVRMFQGAGSSFAALTSTAGSDIGTYDASTTFGIIGDIAEIVVLSGDLTGGGSDIDNLLNYFDVRYGVPGALNQPYYAAIFRGEGYTPSFYETTKIIQSPDGATWDEFLSFYFPPSFGTRDNSILPYNGLKWLAYTNTVETGGNSPAYGVSTSFGVANSIYAHGWAYVTNVSCASIGGLAQTWGPKWYIDGSGNPHILIDCSTGGGIFAIYEVHPTNAGMTTWSNPVALTMGGSMPSNIIDFFLFFFNGTLYAIYKDETTKKLCLATSSNNEWNGTWTQIITNIGGWLALEGCSVIPLSGTSFRVFADDYSGVYNDQTTGGAASSIGHGMHFADGTGNADPTLMSWGTPSKIVWDTTNQASPPEVFWSRNGVFIKP